MSETQKISIGILPLKNVLVFFFLLYRPNYSNRVSNTKQLEDQ